MTSAVISIQNKINKILQELLEQDLIIYYNPAIVLNNSEITWARNPRLSNIFSTSNLYYIYKDCLKSENYTAILKDGGLVQLYYRFDNRGNLQNHRLLYFSINIFNLANVSISDIPIIDHLDEYEIKVMENAQNGEISLFNDPAIAHSMGFIRFDYDSSTADAGHPASHITINKEGSRIPVTKPLCPTKFFSFILRHFYSSDYDTGTKILQEPDTINEEEKKFGHFAGV